MKEYVVYVKFIDGSTHRVYVTANDESEAMDDVITEFEVHEMTGE